MIPMAVDSWNKYKEVYYRLPVCLQNAACTYYGWREARVRFSDVFRERLAFLTASEWWSESEIEAYQNEQLRSLIRHAYEHVPYYRAVMKDRGLCPDDIRTREDLPKLPVLTKEDVRKNADKLVAETADPVRLRWSHTSGTTGKSLHFYRSPEAIAFQWAVWWRHRQRFGIEFGDKHANFTGRPVVDPECTSPPYWRWNLMINQALIPMLHIAPRKVSDLVDFLGRHDFTFYSGAPSFIAPLCVMAQEKGLTLSHQPKVVFTGVENVLDVQRDQIEDFTGARVTDQYGFTEGAGNASECPEGVYHEDFEFGLLECIESTELNRGQGKIVGTGFACPEFPLIRYEIGDIGTWAATGESCRCGRHSAIIKHIDGRIEDYVLTPEGRRVMRFGYVFKDTQDIKESQVVQFEPGSIVVRIVRRPSYGIDTEAHVRKMVHEWISPRLKVTFEYVSEIERESNGKLRAVKSFLGDSTVLEADKCRT